MIRFFLKTTFRNFWQNKKLAAINIIGLSVGMTAAMLILLWVQNELSTDRFYKKTDRIFKTFNLVKGEDGTKRTHPYMPKPLGPALIQNYAEVENAVRVNRSAVLLTYGNQHLDSKGAIVDSGFLNLFDFPVLEGDAVNPLVNSSSIVITEKLAKKVFGNEDPIGKIIRLDSNSNAVVTAILKDLPANTRFEFEYLLPWSYIKENSGNLQDWNNYSPQTYVLLKLGSSESLFDAKIKNIIIDHTKGTSSPSTGEIVTQPLSQAYLYSESEDGKFIGGPIKTVRLFGAIAVFILMIACINFMNLSTARSEKRAKEVGIRKVAGATKGTLIIQFLGESIFLTCIAFAIVLLLTQISLFGFFNQLVGHELYIPYRSLFFWLFATGIVLFTGVVAGSYPAFLLSSFKTVAVLKGTFKKANALITPRKILVVMQFTFATILIIGTVVVFLQIRYALNRNTGYDKNNLIFIPVKGDISKHYASIKNDLLNSDAAVSITESANPITQRWGYEWGFKWDGSSKADEKINFNRLGSDANFVKTFDIKLVEGRDIDIYNYPTDNSAIVLNEAAVKTMGLKKSPIGMLIRRWGDDTTKYHVIGVIKDFILESPFEQKINPIMIYGMTKDNADIIHIKLNPENSTNVNIDKIERIFKEYNPQYPFEYVFVDESYAKKFADVQRTSRFAMLFAALTIFISCLGLFALATYMAESRSKEIAVRKVLGASIFTITALQSRAFLQLVLLSFLIASPIAWYIVHEWLSSFTYRVSIEWWIFALSGVLSVVIAAVSVGYQSIRAAMANPIKGLRVE